MRFISFILPLLIFNLAFASAQSCQSIFNKPHSEQIQASIKKSPIEDFQMYLDELYPSDAALFYKLRQSRIFGFRHPLNAFSLSLKVGLSRMKNKDHHSQMLYLATRLFEEKLTALAGMRSMNIIPINPSKKVDLVIETLLSHLHKREEVSLDAVFSGLRNFEPQMYHRSGFSLILRSLLMMSFDKPYLLNLLRTDLILQRMIKEADFEGLRSYLKSKLSPVAYADWFLRSSFLMFDAAFAYLVFAVSYTWQQGDDLSKFIPDFNIHLSKAQDGERISSIWNFASLINYYANLHAYYEGDDFSVIEQQYLNDLERDGAFSIWKNTLVDSSEEKN